MRVDLKGPLFLGIWAVMAVIAGSILMSFHQPFQQPGAKILALTHAPSSDHPQWRAIHILSGSCGCSQRVMQHLLARQPFAQMHEEVLLIDGPEPYLNGSAVLASRLEDKGFEVQHVPVADISLDSGLRGVPILVFASPEDKVVYLGGYGSSGDKDGEILEQIRLNRAPKPLPIIGCAIGAQLRRRVDPFHFKY